MLLVMCVRAYCEVCVCFCLFVFVKAKKRGGGQWLAKGQKTFELKCEYITYEGGES